MPLIQSDQGTYFEYTFTTSFEETNLVGNIYFANYVVWQGKCREMFLKEYSPGIVEEINNGLALITLDLSVQYRSQLHAFDKVLMKMFLEAQSESRLLMSFQYFNATPDTPILVAEGTQAVAAMRVIDGQLTSVRFPDSVLNTLESLVERY